MVEAIRGSQPGQVDYEAIKDSAPGKGISWTPGSMMGSNGSKCCDICKEDFTIETA